MSEQMSPRRQLKIAVQPRQRLPEGAMLQRSLQNGLVQPREQQHCETLVDDAQNTFRELHTQMRLDRDPVGYRKPCFRAKPNGELVHLLTRKAQIRDKQHFFNPTSCMTLMETRLPDNPVQLSGRNLTARLTQADPDSAIYGTDYHFLTLHYSLSVVLRQISQL